VWKGAEEARRCEEESRRQAEEARRQQEEAQRREEARRPEDEARQRAEEMKWREDEARRREEEANRAAEQIRQVLEETRRREGELRQREEEDRRREEDRQLAEEIKRVEQEAHELEAEPQTCEAKSNRQEEEVKKAEIKAQEKEERAKWPSEEEINSAQARIEYNSQKLHIAICGSSDAGKSSLINAFRGFANHEPGAAPARKTTLAIDRYPDARVEFPYSHFVWFDIPGAGTLDIPDWQYFNKQGLLIFDVIVLVYDVSLVARYSMPRLSSPIYTAIHKDRRGHYPEL
jgi:hypothetical protein